MRLIEITADGRLTLTRKYFDRRVPQYAILSHTWGPYEDEISYEDLKNGSAEGKRGYGKLEFTRDQAVRDGFEYIWVDTCCINSSDHSEVQESINSMFLWYQNAAKCYVFLTDVSNKATPEPNTGVVDDDDDDWASNIRSSRWFTRGWTLQELLAPRSVEFFSKEGARLGDKKSLEKQISLVTGISADALRGSQLSSFTVAERIRWQDGRDTLRKEDTAYSLLGIFGIQMPLLYGEGREKAFHRLRREIVENSTAFSHEKIVLATSIRTLRVSCTFETAALNVKPSDEPFLQFDNGVAFRYGLDGHFFIRWGNGVLAWETKKYGKKGSGRSLTFQSDGNLVAYNHRVGPMWASNTDRNYDCRLVLSSAKPFIEIFTPDGVRIYKSL